MASPQAIASASRAAEACHDAAVRQPQLSPRAAQGGLGREGELERVEERLLSPLPRRIDLVQGLRRRSGENFVYEAGAGHQGVLRQEGHASLLRSADRPERLMGCVPQARSETGRDGGRRSPLVDRIVFCQREPSTRCPEVSNRIPATSMKTWPWCVQIVTHLPRPGSPQLISGPEASGPSSSPALASANDTEPEQS